MSRHVAEWFAKCRGGSHHALLTTKIKKSDVTCLWDDKGESEILIIPSVLEPEKVLVEKFVEVHNVRTGTHWRKSK